MKRILCVIPLATALLTGCSAETENVVSETTTHTESVNVTEKVTMAETTVTEATTTAETTTIQTTTTIPETTTEIVTTTTVSETELPVTTQETDEVEKDDIDYWISLNYEIPERQFIIGNEKALNSFVHYLGYTDNEKFFYDYDGNYLVRFAEGVDFSKNAIALYISHDYRSSDYFKFNNVYVENGEVIFDYDVRSCKGVCTDDEFSYIMVGIVPKKELTSLGNDEWGVEITADYDYYFERIYLTFTQWGEKDISELISGSWYELERYDEEKGWCKVEYAPEFQGQEIVWTEEGWTITEYGAVVFEQYLTLYGGRLERGDYRIAKKIINLQKPGDFEEKIYYAEFFAY